MSTYQTSPETLAVIETFIAQYSFDPTRIYCQVTGKPIGRFDDEEFDAIVNEVGNDDFKNGDFESAADDLAIRLLASMRPSMRWNKFRDDTLVNMRVKHPVETLAYLVNRFFAPLNHRKIGIEPLLGYYEDRIRSFKAIQEWGVNDGTNTLLYMLLELDAKWNLDTESPPFNCRDFLEAPNMDARVAMVQGYYTRRVADWDKKMKADETQVRWSRSGSALAKPAFMAAFLDNKPLTQTAIKKAEKKAEKDFFAGVLAEIMGVKQTPEEFQASEPSPVFVPIRKMPMKFGVKK